MPLSETPVVILLQTVFNSILQVFLVCLAGYLLAHVGILDKKTQKQLNRLNVSLFTPALLFSKVAFFLTPSKLKELWIIPIFFIVVTTISMITAQIIGWAMRLKRSQRAFATAASMFMNSNSLPIALMQSLVFTVPNLKWEADDNQDAMIGRALTYLVMYSTLGMVLRWSYGVRLLAQADDEVPGDGTHITSEPADIEHATERTPLLNKLSSVKLQSTTPIVPEAPTISDNLDAEPTPLSKVAVENAPSSPMKHTNPNTLRPSPLRKRTTTFYNSFPNTPNASRTSLHMPPVFKNPEDENGLPRQASSTSLSTSSSSSSDDENEAATPIPDHQNDASTSTLIDPPSPQFHRRPHESEDGSVTVADPNAVEELDSQSSPKSPQTPHRRGSHHHQSEEHRHPLTFKQFLRNVANWFKQLAINIDSFMTVPLYAAILSLIVACIPPLQHYLMVHAWPIKGSLEQLGSVSIPMTLVVLGAYFYAPQSAEVQEDPRSFLRKIKDLLSPGEFFTNLQKAFSSSNDPATKGETKTVFVAILSRMILTPVILLPLMVVSTVWDLHEVFTDPVFVVSNTLLVSSPPALTLAQITQAASGDAFERLISKTIFWSYCVVTPPMTILWVVIGLVLSKL